jgi:hypothetical protein
MGYLRNLLASSFAAAFALGACAKSNVQEGGSSETHFLAACNASCDEGYGCLCGTCTQACSDDSACKALSSDATCQGATADECGVEAICDVECVDDADCDALGKHHVCDDGHCRAPMLAINDAGEAGSAGAGGNSRGDAGDLPPGECSLAQYVSTLLSGDIVEDCSPVVDDVAADSASCVRAQMNALRPFSLQWPAQGADSEVKNGFVGIYSRPRYTIYKVHYDSAGFSGDDFPGDVWQLSLNVCTNFFIAPECDSFETCFECEVDATVPSSGCVPSEDGTLIVASHGGLPDGVRCAEGSCLIDDVCYPDGSSTEDGCCTCSNSQPSCIERASCPRWPQIIGKRCDNDDQCKLSADSELQCQPSFGSGGLTCAHPCNLGCPTGTECAFVASTGRHFCQRGCSSNDDCVDTLGESLGSECAQGFCQ